MYSQDVAFKEVESTTGNEMNIKRKDHRKWSFN